MDSIRQQKPSKLPRVLIIAVVVFVLDHLIPAYGTASPLGDSDLADLRLQRLTTDMEGTTVLTQAHRLSLWRECCDYPSSLHHTRMSASFFRIVHTMYLHPGEQSTARLVQAYSFFGRNRVRGFLWER